MSTRRGGKVGHSYACRKRYAIRENGFKRPAPKPPAQSKADLRRIAEMAFRKWLDKHRADGPPNT